MGNARRPLRSCPVLFHFAFHPVSDGMEFLGGIFAVQLNELRAIHKLDERLVQLQAPAGALGFLDQFPGC